MSTLGAMITEILDDLDRSTSETSAVRTKIQAAIRHYQRHRFWFNESRSVTFNAADGTKDYSFATIGTEFYTIDGVFLTNGSQIIELDRTDYTLIEQQADDTSEAVPSEYGYVAKGLRLHNTPDATYAVRITGHVKLAAPADDAEAGNDWMVEAYDLIKARAKAELYLHRYSMPNDAIAMQAAERSALNSLDGATQEKTGGGYLVATDF